VSPKLQESEHRGDGKTASEQRTLACTLVLNAGWVRGDGEPLESEQTSVSVDVSEPLPSLQQHTSSGLLQEELHLFQPVSLERATTREY